MITINTLFKPEVSETEDFTTVMKDAVVIYEFLKKNEMVINEIKGNKSVDRELFIKDIMTNKLGYQHQVGDMFHSKKSFVVDFYKQTSPENGVIVEVEGGGTIPNNHYIKDYEKTQACTKASFLILVIPNRTVNNVVDTYEYKFSSPYLYDRGIDGLFLIGY